MKIRDDEEMKIQRRQEELECIDTLYLGTIFCNIVLMDEESNCRVTKASNMYYQICNNIIKKGNY